MIVAQNCSFCGASSSDRKRLISAGAVSDVEAFVICDVCVKAAHQLVHDERPNPRAPWLRVADDNDSDDIA